MSSKIRVLLLALAVPTVVVPGCDSNPGGPSAAAPSEKVGGEPPPPLEKSAAAKVKEATTVAP